MILLDVISLKCPSCGGSLEFNSSMTSGFCQYCGAKVAIPRKSSSAENGFSDTTKFYLFIYYKGEQTQHAIKDEVTLKVGYRAAATTGDPNPLELTVSTNGLAIPIRNKLSSDVGVGTIQISGIGSSLTLSKEQKLKIGINGTAISINSSRLYYGDLVSIGNIIIRIQPMSQ